MSKRQPPPARTTIKSILDQRLQLRSELRFEFEQFSGRPCFRVEDPVNGQLYRIGADEYKFISLLDGVQTVREVVASSAQKLHESAFSDAQAKAICRWLVENGLVNAGESSSILRSRQQNRSHRARLMAYLNPFYIRIPLTNPDRFLARLLSWAGWLFSKPGLVLWCLVLVTAACQVAANWSRFERESIGVLAPGNWWALAIGWCLLKLMHELAHGIACKRYGGTVSEAGLVFILFAPLAYVDASGAWRAASKWQRIVISSAGIYVDLFMSAVAALIWVRTDSQNTAQWAYGMMTMASVSTLLFNGNPLMRFDAYYVLSDLLEVPNLYARGQQIWLHRAKRWLLGISPHGVSPQRGLKTRFMEVYGALCIIWRGVVICSLLMASYGLFQGAGIIVSCLGIVLWFGVPLWSFAKYAMHGKGGERPSLARFLCMAAVAASVLLAILTLIPWPGVVSAPGTLVAAPWRAVRTDVDGFVARVHVHEGQTVQAGQMLVTLESPELQIEGQSLELDVRAARLRLDQLREQGNWAKVQVQQQYLESIVQRLNETQRHLQHLIIRSPIEGRVVTPHPEHLARQFVQAGEEVITVIGDRREVRLSVDQLDVDRFAAWLGRPVQITLEGMLSRKLAGKLTELNPHGSDTILQPALAITNGGPLAVAAKYRDDEPATSAGDTPQRTYVSPRFEARVELGDRESDFNYFGGMARARFRPVDRSIGTHLSLTIRQFLARRLGRKAA